MSTSMMYVDRIIAKMKSDKVTILLYVERKDAHSHEGYGIYRLMKGAFNDYINAPSKNDLLKR